MFYLVGRKSSNRIWIMLSMSAEYSDDPVSLVRWSIFSSVFSIDWKYAPKTGQKRTGEERIHICANDCNKDEIYSTHSVQYVYERSLEFSYCSPRQASVNTDKHIYFEKATKTKHIPSSHSRSAKHMAKRHYKTNIYGENSFSILFCGAQSILSILYTTLEHHWNMLHADLFIDIDFPQWQMSRCRTDNRTNCAAEILSLCQCGSLFVCLTLFVLSCGLLFLCVRWCL